MVVKVGAFGLHVAFYNGVVGLVPMRHLKKHGVDNPSEAFRVGQVLNRLEQGSYISRIYGKHGILFHRKYARIRF